MNGMQTVSVRAVLSFRDATGKVGTFSVPRAKPGVTAQEAMNAMQDMIASGALELHGLESNKSVKGAKLVQTMRKLVV